MSAFAPTSVAALSALLKEPSLAEQAFAPEGAGGHGAALPPGDAAIAPLSLRQLKAIRSHRADELLVVAEAGLGLADLQAELALRGQWLPAWDARPESSLGGLLVSDRTGPWRAGHGRLADRVLWAEAVLADGSVVRSGAQVVKSVAGYDWTRLLVGSEGAFGALGAVALKVAPLPPTRRAWVLAHEGLEPLLGLAERAWGLRAAALELSQDAGGPWRLALVLEGHAADVGGQMGQLQGAWGGAWPEELPWAEAFAPAEGAWQAELRWQGAPMALPEGPLLQAIAGATWVGASPAWGAWRAGFAAPAQALGALGELQGQGLPWSWRLRPDLQPPQQALWAAALGPTWWGPRQGAWPLLARLKATHDPQDRWQRGRLARAIAHHEG